MADNSRLETDGVQKDNVEIVTCILDSYNTDRKLYLSFLDVPSRALRLCLWPAVPQGWTLSQELGQILDHCKPHREVLSKYAFEVVLL